MSQINVIIPSREDVIAEVACPTCGVPQGSQCDNRAASGAKVPNHRERMFAARRQRYDKIKRRNNA